MSFSILLHRGARRCLACIGSPACGRGASFCGMLAGMVHFPGADAAVSGVSRGPTFGRLIDHCEGIQGG